MALEAFALSRGHHRSRVWKGDQRNRPAPSTPFSTGKRSRGAAEPPSQEGPWLPGWLARWLCQLCESEKAPLSPATLPDGRADGRPVPLGP